MAGDKGCSPFLDCQPFICYDCYRFFETPIKNMKKALVLGFGVSGKAATQLLLNRGYLVAAADRNASIQKKSDEIKAFLAKGVEFFLDDLSLCLDGIDLAVISPGIPPSHPLIKKIEEKKIPKMGEIELGFEALSDQKILGVTGSNGKTTTSLLTEHLLKESGIKAVALGNVGNALSLYALRPEKDTVLIVELSSFQLESLTIAPRFDAAVILNITPNHLNRHASMEEYADAKLRIAACLKPNGKLFLSRDIVEKFGAKLKNLNIGPFDSSCLKKWEIFEEQKAVFLENGLRLGLPEIPNIQAAFSLSGFCGLTEEKNFSALKTFRKPPHRIEWVAEINQVAYYNDSKASNVEAVMHAVKLFAGPIILIAGGVDKGSPYQPWIDCFQGKVKGLIVFGEAAAKMEKELAAHFSLKRVETLEQAVEYAKTWSCPGDTVLFSPGCSSYDQFANYEQRGDAFKGIMRGK